MLVDAFNDTQSPPIVIYKDTHMFEMYTKLSCLNKLLLQGLSRKILN